MAKITEIMLLQQKEQTALIIENQADMKTFGNLIGEGFRKIGTYLSELGEVTTDIPFAEYPAYEEITEDNIKMAVGFYTARVLPAMGDIKNITIPARKVVVCLHKGNYNELAALYNEMAQWIAEKGYTPSGTSIEHYYTGPETPETEQVTRVVMPVE